MTTPAPMSQTRLPRAARAAVAGVLALALAGCGGSSEPASTPTAASPFSPYVALGDSYTAVSGTDAELGDACLRSSSAYPTILAEKLGIAEVTSVACGGATSENLTATQYPLGKGRNEPQLDALDAGTKLVTVGIGLNDNGYSSLTLISCFLLNGREQAACARYLDRPQSDLDELVAAMGRNVAASLTQIKAAAPNARIVFIGYPRLLPDRGSCPDQVPLAQEALPRVRASGVDVNRTLKQVTSEAGVDFVDMYDASEGHDVCSATPWVNGQRTVLGEAFAFHPFPAYHVAVADRVAALLGAG